MPDTHASHGLRIELSRCSESLDLFENEQELEKVISWILMMNRLDMPRDFGRPALEIRADEMSFSVEVSCTDKGDIAFDAEEQKEEKRARNVVADLLGLFDPAEHRVVRWVNGESERDDRREAPVALWPRERGKRQFAHQARPR